MASKNHSFKLEAEKRLFREPLILIGNPPGRKLVQYFTQRTPEERCNISVETEEDVLRTSPTETVVLINDNVEELKQSSSWLQNKKVIEIPQRIEQAIPEIERLCKSSEYVTKDKRLHLNYSGSSKVLSTLIPLFSLPKEIHKLSVSAIVSKSTVRQLGYDNEYDFATKLGGEVVMEHGKFPLWSAIAVVNFHN